MRPKILLIILDGFGNGKDYPFNAIKNAHMPFYKECSHTFPRSELITCGEAVGLPKGVMGNSEVGHMNLGAGRIVYQELTRINKAIKAGEFQKNKEINDAISSAQKKSTQLHLMGLLSDAGVHSHLSHLKALIEMAVPKVSIVLHLFTDGRDSSPTSGFHYVKDILDFIHPYSNVTLGSISGRYYAMDRDQRWDRIQKAWQAITGQIDGYPSRKESKIHPALLFMRDCYDKKMTDEFIIPTRFEYPHTKSFVDNNDSVIFYNFRADRARQLTRAFEEPTFKEFSLGKRPKLSKFLCMTQYDKNFKLPVAFLPQNLSHIFPNILTAHHLKQFRIAETEKYAHVTFFFNGGREQPYPDEQRCLIASPKDVPTYDLKPEMSAPEVTQNLCHALEKEVYSFVLVNYANPDMVGHTGKFDAAIKALQTIDLCLKQCITTALNCGYEVLLTSDHGNIEEMQDEHRQPHTQHTLNPVPFHYLSKNLKYKIKDGILADVAPTMLEIMGLPKPEEMTGHSLCEK